MSVIINDEDAVWNESRDEMLKLVPCGLIPIGVQPKHCNLGRCLLRQCLFDWSLHKVEPGLGVSGTPQVAADILDRGVGPNALGRALRLRQERSSRLTRSRPGGREAEPRWLEPSSWWRIGDERLDPFDGGEILDVGAVDRCRDEAIESRILRPT